jgi:hypothetical protein
VVSLREGVELSKLHQFKRVSSPVNAMEHRRLSSPVRHD